jgi:hypothetical protein
LDAVLAPSTQLEEELGGADIGHRGPQEAAELVGKGGVFHAFLVPELSAA